jgi:uncharacterized protein DUF5995
MSAKAAKQTPSAKTIDEVIERLDEIISRSRRERSRLGYFAALYRNVTVEVKRGIAAGRFQDGPRMERLDVNFANRYLEALESFSRSERASKSWVFAFEVVKQWPPIVLQHLLIGMNAHINLDLGVAAAMTCPGDDLPPLKSDFDEINNILSAMTAGVQWRLAQISPFMKLLNRYTGKVDDAIMNWSIGRARDHAWGVAVRLAPLDPKQTVGDIEKLDDEVDVLAHLVRYPGLALGFIKLFVRVSEVRSVSRIIDILA